ncbi:unnamed protein product [Chilo suppressalis]|uniref:Trissin n=1 Tax=Chilo suppressalis TaxID=168631 RepID=A0ABN8BBZ9_CHISP|nr:unnamed protein product [Chilo suppressalis]
MFKITAIVSLVLIGSTLWASGLSCDSCGSECLSACGTRHFRSCCFNYLRKKRGPDAVKLWSPSFQDKGSRQERLPMFAVKSVAEPWYSNAVASNNKPFPYDDTLENHFQLVYDV